MRYRPIGALLLLAALSLGCGEDESPAAGSIVLNEIGCHGRDFVEVVNISEAELDIGEWILTDGLTKTEHYFAIPSGTLIQVGEYLVIKQLKDEEAGFVFGLSCGDETVYLLDADKAVVDQVDIGTVAYTSTWGHLPDKLGLWRETCPTAGAENQPVEICTQAS